MRTSPVQSTPPPPYPRRPLRALAPAAAAAIVLGSAGPSWAEAGEQAPEPDQEQWIGGVPRERECRAGRPVSEWSTWIRLGGGARDGADREAEGLFDFGGGGEVTFGLTRGGDVRAGPWVELRTRTFASLDPTGGLELFFGALPAGLDLFHYRGEGVLSFRVGAGYTFRGIEGPGLEPEGALVTGTVAYGYRAPFRLWDSYGTCDCDLSVPGGYGTCRRTGRYMIPVRLYVTAEGTVTGPETWTITAGLELEPAGSFRYIFGLT